MKPFLVVVVALSLCLFAVGQTPAAPVVAATPVATATTAAAPTTTAVPSVAAIAPAPLQNVYGAGISYNAAGSPSIAGTGLYAHLIANTGTYAFTVLDVLPNNTPKFTVSTNIGAGIAQKVATIAGADIFVPTSAGIQYQGSNVGWQASTGAMAIFKLKNSWLLMPSVRVVKGSVANGTGVQPIIGFMLGWGK